MLHCDGMRPHFLMSGCTQAVFKYTGMQPEDKELVIIIDQPRASHIQYIIEKFRGHCRCRACTVERLRCNTVIVSSFRERAIKLNKISWLWHGASIKASGDIIFHFIPLNLSIKKKVKIEDIPH